MLVGCRLLIGIVKGDKLVVNQNIQINPAIYKDDTIEVPFDSIGSDYQPKDNDLILHIGATYDTLNRRFMLGPGTVLLGSLKPKDQKVPIKYTEVTAEMLTSSEYPPVKIAPIPR